MEVNFDPSTAVCVLTPPVFRVLLSVIRVLHLMTLSLCSACNFFSLVCWVPSDFETDNSLNPRSVPWRAVYTVQVNIHSTPLELLQG